MLRYHLPFLIGLIKAEYELVYKMIDNYEIVYQSDSKGYHTDLYDVMFDGNTEFQLMPGSFWKVQRIDSDFCSIGDLTAHNHDQPQQNAIIVSDLIRGKTTGSVKSPNGFKEVWGDYGSGASPDLTIWEMIPESGYTCLGHVATASREKPNVKDYCCVKTAYVGKAKSIALWDDSQTNSNTKVKFHSIYPVEGSAGINCGTFLAKAENAVINPTLLQVGGHVGDAFQVDYKPRDEDPKPLQLYPSRTASDKRWDNTNNSRNGKFSTHWASIWRVPGTEKLRPVSDVYLHETEPHAPENGYLISAIEGEEDALKWPLSYHKIMDNKNRVGAFELSIWKPECPPFYQAIGTVATPFYSDGHVPPLKSITCIKDEYVQEGCVDDWVQRHWYEKGERSATHDYKIYVGKSLGCHDSLWSVNSLYGHNSWDKPSPPVHLKKEFVEFMDRPIVIRREIEEIMYDEPTSDDHGKNKKRKGFYRWPIFCFNLTRKIYIPDVNDKQKVIRSGSKFAKKM